MSGQANEPGTRRCPWPIEHLLPHRPPMLLLDEAVAYDATMFSAAVRITPLHQFFSAADRGVPAHVGLELMAQACGGFAGAEALAAGVPVKVGFLLGTRDYQATRAWFADGERLLVTATLAFRDAEMGVFDCRIESAGDTVATARLNVYQPADLGAVLNKSRPSHG